MRKLLIFGTLAIIGASGAVAATTHHTFTGANLVRHAQVTLAAARAAALVARPGVITDQELEREGGGSGLRYSFDIKSNGKIFEVGVDANTGRILENAAEGPHPD